MGSELALSALPGTPLGNILAELPSDRITSERIDGDVYKIEQHLRTVGGHAGEFAEEIQRFLA
jgi:hypothetical protein